MERQRKRLASRVPDWPPHRGRSRSRYFGMERCSRDELRYWVTQLVVSHNSLSLTRVKAIAMRDRC